MIDVGNRPRWSQKGTIGLKRTVSAFGIVGKLRVQSDFSLTIVFFSSY